jgi:hypothetical protein
MQPPLATEAPPIAAPDFAPSNFAGPRFYVTKRQPIRPAAIMLAILTAVGTLTLVAFGLGHSKAAHYKEGTASASRSPDTPNSATPEEDPEDDPSQVDTIVLGDAADAPVPARKKDRVSPVHATIIIHLPRYGQQTGLIPDTPSGHLLYGWLAAFNQGSDAALEKAVPNIAPVYSSVAQMVLRHQNGGFNLLSAREVQPGVLVFRLRDQTPEATEVLGTLQVRANSNPAAIASFSLRAIPQVSKNAATAATPTSATSSR